MMHVYNLNEDVTYIVGDPFICSQQNSFLNNI